jgi:RHS repeat-associated protein
MVYGPAGKMGQMLGQTLNYAYVPLPGGSSAMYWTGNFYYTHKDWLGSGRLNTTIPASGNGVLYYDRQFSPFGEVYGNSGSAYGLNFTGDTQDAFGSLYDTPNRELNQSQGRWLTPDPAGAGWNLYAYLTNPNSFTDRSGLGADEGAPSFIDGQGVRNLETQTCGAGADQTEPCVRADTRTVDKGCSNANCVTVTATAPKSVWQNIGSWFGAVGAVISRSLGSWGGDRAGKRFTRSGRQVVINLNAAQNGGQPTCVSCERPLVPSTQSRAGVTPAGNELRVDHTYPQSQLGDGNPETNGQLLCFDCNAEKSDSLPVTQQMIQEENPPFAPPSGDPNSIDPN